MFEEAAVIDISIACNASSFFRDSGVRPDANLRIGA